MLILQMELLSTVDCNVSIIKLLLLLFYFIITETFADLKWGGRMSDLCTIVRPPLFSISESVNECAERQKMVRKITRQLPCIFE